MARRNNTLLYAAIGAGALLLLSSRNQTQAQPPTCPPGYYWNGQICVKLPTGVAPNQGSGSGFFNSAFWNQLPNILQGTQQVIQSAQSNKVGFITYQMRY